MSNINETLAKRIAAKLQEENILASTDSQLATSLANGSMKEVDWKLLLETFISKPKPRKTPSTNETT